MSNTSIEVTAEFDNSVVRTEIQGALNPESARLASQQALTLGREIGCTRFLIVLNEVEDEFNTMQRYTHMSTMEERGFRHSERFAMVVSTGDDRYAFTEDIAVNRGFKLRVFTDEPTAVEWLLSD